MKKTALIIIATLLAVGQEAWATEFITDVMLIGGTKSEVDTLKTTYQNDGWKIIDQDLNAGCGSGSDYIYLLYKTADNYTTGNLTFITDFYISTSSGTAPDEVSYNKHNYHLVPFDGGAHFKSVKGDLNSNCGSSSDDIHLYYIKDKVTNNYEPVSSIVFNTTKSGAVGKNGGTNGYDLNAGCGSGSDYIYMHITKERAHWWNIEKTADGRKCRLIDISSGIDNLNVKAVPAIIEGATVVDIYLDVPFTVFTNLETFYFDKSTEVSTMPNVAGCTNFIHVTTIDGYGNVKEDELPPSITSIPESAFKNTNVKNLTMPKVSSIGAYAFYGCDSLTSVSIGNNIASIGNFAFKGCTQLTKANISDLAVWCNISFGNSESNPMYCSHNLYLNNEKITNLTIPDNVTSIGSNAFCFGTDLTSVSFPSSVTNIGSQAFYCCTGLPSVTIGDNVENIGSYAFYGCTGLPSVTIPNSVTNIGDKAFGNCTALKTVSINSNAIVSKDYTSSSIQDIFGPQVKKYTIGNDVTSIGKYVFYGCYSLDSVSIPNSVTSIGGYAFYNCSAMISINIPNSVTSIGKSAFRKCFSLTDIYFDGTETQWENVTKGTDWRSDVPSSCKEHWHCTVTFDANGHGTAPTAQTNLWSNEAKAMEPDAPTASGFVFTGWYTDAACTTWWNFGSDVVPGDMTLYAGWAEVLGSSYTLEVPEQVTIVPNTEWTTVTVDVTALKMQLMADGRTPQFLRLTFNYGTLTDQADNSKTIPFKLATMNSDTEMEQSNQNVYEAGQKQFRIHISSAHWSAATPGTYSGTVSYTVRWRFDNNTWSGDLETGTIPVTVTIPETNSATGIDSIGNGQWTMDHSWYSIDGRKLSGKPTKKGIYILNGEKVVVK